MWFQVQRLISLGTGGSNTQQWLSSDSSSQVLWIRAIKLALRRNQIGTYTLASAGTAGSFPLEVGQHTWVDRQVRDR